MAEHFDVLLIGAGISGIGCARHLSSECPQMSYAVLEAKESFGGTWLTHTYPGIRSDSDLHTFGYQFKPWIGPAIATADEILKYLDDVIEENGLASRLRYGVKVVSASWSSSDRIWSVEAIVTETAERQYYTARFLWMCQGYYSHSKGYTPDWKGMNDFRGEIVHPQSWPDALDVSGRKIVVIGSGATAATLLPALADECEHVTMLQRSPTYYLTSRKSTELTNMLRALEIDEEWIHEITRRFVVREQTMFANMAEAQPEAVKQELIAAVREHLGDDYDIETHFTPRYRPWQQRIAFVPDGDLFKAIRSGRASVVTAQIDRFVPDGILLRSGERLDADIIVTATGFNLSIMGDIAFAVDGEPLDWSQTITYRGMMFTGVPNLAWVCGYFRMSWTLRAELIAGFVCRLLQHMEAAGENVVRLDLGAEERDVELSPFVDAEEFYPGYMMRSVHLFPKRIARQDWQMSQDYLAERSSFESIDLSGPDFAYE